jgi:hypothetical protein
MGTRLSRLCAPAALLVAAVALVLAASGIGEAARKPPPRPSTKPKPFGLLQLNKKGKFPASAIPKVRAARNADRVGRRTSRQLTLRCNAESVDLGTWCLSSALYSLGPEDAGKNDYFFASQRCVEEGGYLPTAAQLVGAADRVKLASTIDDAELTSAKDLDPTDGLKDRREMSATLVTTQAGSSAAGSIGVSEGSTGDPKAGEPNPAPLPAVPAPETLQYVTVYDNGNEGGFAGSKPVSQPENFRCAFDKAQGAGAADEG